MATYTGENGAVYFGTDSAGESIVTNVRSWTLDHTKETIDSSVMGSGARTYKNGMHTFTGSVEVVFDSAHLTSHRNMVDPSYDDDVFIELWTSTDSGAQKFTGKVIVTSVSRTASFDDLITATINFQGNGALGFETVA